MLGKTNGRGSSEREQSIYAQPMAHDQVRQLAIQIAVLSESSGAEIEEILAALTERCGSPPGASLEKVMVAAHIVRDFIVERRREYRVAKNEDQPRERAGLLANVGLIEHLLKRQMRPGDLN